MTIVPFAFHSFSDVVVSGVGAINSVSAGPDSGANNNLACAFWKSMRHSTTKQAIDNFISRMPASLAEPGEPDEDILGKGIGQLNICGHGNEGLFTTGCGQDGAQDYKTNLMANWNEFYWGPELGRLKGANFTILTIWSCHSGAGEEGADFLYAIAKQIGLPVRGNTGWLYSNSKCRVWQEKGAQWQVATPDRRPDAIPSPTPHFAPVDSKSVAFEGEEDMFTSENISGLRLIARDIASREFTTEVDIPPELQMEIVQRIVQSAEMELPGRPLGYFSHKLQAMSGKEVLFEFGIMNKRMIVSGSESRGILVPSGLREFL